jgi:hypothetical protein
LAFASPKRSSEPNQEDPWLPITESPGRKESEILHWREAQ